MSVRWLLLYYALLLLIGIGGAVGDILISKWAKVANLRWLGLGLLSWLVSLMIFGLALKYFARTLSTTFILAAASHIGIVLAWDWMRNHSRLDRMEMAGILLIAIGIVVIELSAMKK